MLDLNEVAVFIEVARAGSFTKAARVLGMPNSTVSSKVSSLERRLGLTLIQRTTRSLHVTPAGQTYFQRCLDGLTGIAAAEEELAASQGEPRGQLRITAPVELGSTILPEVVSAFTRRHPKVAVEIVLADRRVDLLGEGVDLAIRAGELKDSSMIAKKLGLVYFALFATPAYVRAHGKPEHPRELKDHDCIQFTPLGATEWKLSGPRSTIAAKVPGRVVTNDLAMVKRLTLMSGGLSLLPSFFCDQELQRGSLVRLLPDWRTNVNPVHFVYPAQRFVPPKLSAFIEESTTTFQNYLRPTV